MRVLIVFASVLVASSAQLPSSVVICKQSDPELDKCIETAIQAFLQAISDEDFAFPLDPLNFDALGSNFEVPGVFDGSITSRDVELIGISQSKVSDVETMFTDDSMIMSARFSTPKMLLNAKCVAEIFFGFISKDFDGQLTIVMTNVDTKIRIEGDTENIGGVDYMRIKNVKLIPHPEKIALEVAGLEQFYLDLLSQTWELLYEQLLPKGRAAWKPRVIELVNQVFAEAPYRTLLPKD